MKKIKLTKLEYILIIAALIIFIEPQSFKGLNFSYLGKIDAVYKVLKILISAPIMYIYLKKIKYSKNIFLMILFQMLALLSTLINGGDIVRFIGPAITTIVMIACGELIWLSNKTEDTAKKMNKYFRVLFCVNILTVILVDYFDFFGSRMIYLLGIENRWVFTYIPWMIFEFVEYYYNDKTSKKTIVWYLLMLFSLFFKWSVAAMLIMTLYVLLFNENLLNKLRINIKYYYAILLVNIGIVFFKIQYLFEGLIRKLGKDPTISGRTFLWDHILNDTPSKIIFGHGMQSIAYDKAYFFESSGKFKLPFLRVIHAHNTFMNILYRYGIVPLILFIYQMYYNIKKICETKNRYKNIFLITLIIILLLSFFDTIDCAGFYLCMGFISFINQNQSSTISIKIRIKNLLKNKKIYKYVESLYHFLYRMYCNFIGSIFNLFPIQNNKIVISSYYGKSYGDNAKYIAESLLKKDVKIVWLLKKEYQSKNNIPEKIKTVEYNSIRGLYEMATAKVWIDNSRKNFYPPKRKEQYYIQTWHSSLRLKMIEKDAEDFLDTYYISLAKKDSQMIDLITSGCGFSTNIYRNSFWYNGEILECGSPRCDLFFDKKQKEQIKNKVYDLLKIENDKKIILYAPTFRKKSESKKDYMDCDYVAKNINKDYILVVRYHPIEEYRPTFDANIIDATNYEDMQELICVADMLITDYSGCCFDAMINQTPCYLLSKDKDSYLKKERNLYFDYDNLPFIHASNEDELLMEIKNFDQKIYQTKIDKFCKEIALKENGNASEKIVNRIMKVIKGEKV